MEYFLIIVLQLLGIGFHVMQKVVILGDQYTDKTPRQIFAAFLKADWDTLFVSALVLITDLTVHFILNYYTNFMDESFSIPGTKDFTVSYLIISFGIALVLGYAGQRVIYKLLGSAAKNLENKSI